MRLDKLISDKMNITRSQAKALIKSGSVYVNGAAVLLCDKKVGETDSITADGRQISTSRFVYIMMNKPEGVICATGSEEEKTVLDILPEDMAVRGLFPAGRLDKDTTGFVLLTDDGEFAHRILSPKNHIVKTYIATLDKPCTDEVISDFEGGMLLGDEKLLPAKLKILSGNTVQVEISQGIYHQIKRMFKKHGITVLALKRTAMGNVLLDEKLALGECRYLTDEEIAQICKKQ
ncbi:MAG: 16S rRNA pseudouridine(516) synthase [Ruminococcaceae bacterium]|nr:16S rRNA pseudouridine(516) synthase [Oscillospiraceae bacterium]